MKLEQESVREPDHATIFGMQIDNTLERTLESLPPKPGCYLMKDKDGQVIYVGKAVNLRTRVRSYFHVSKDHGLKTRELVRRIANIECIIQQSELESLLLEYNLINRYQPKFNVRWKDDKRYPYIKVHWADSFPKVTVSRRVVADGSRYFGPYTNVWAMHKTLNLLRKIFRYLTCDRVITGQDERACLYWDIKLCAAPCIGACNQDDYRATMDSLCNFLDGKTDSVAQKIRSEMEQAATELKFERAAAARDQLLSIEQIVEKQRVISSSHLVADVISFHHCQDIACVQIFFVREGKLIGRENFVLEGTDGEDTNAILTAFIKHFYHKSSYVPHELILPHEPSESKIIEQWLRDLRGGRKVSITIPKRGTKHELVRMATENAVEALATLSAQWDFDANKQETALSEIKAALSLPNSPHRIECYDISNSHGTNATGSMVVFHRGNPTKSHYRRFTIRTISGQDDCASMREILSRRFNQWRDQTDLESSDPVQNTGQDNSFANIPDLLIVDGGKGQLTSASGVLAEYGLAERVPLIALAKQDEKIFRPGQVNPIMLPRRSPGLFLLQRIRDEAHRFALFHHRIKRGRTSLASKLEDIPGIGPIRRKALLRQFGSLNAIRDASFEEISRVRGISKTSAQSLKDSL